MRQPERIGHCAADEQRIRLFQQPVNDLDLIRDLCPAKNDDERAGRLVQLVAQKLQFALHQQAGGALAAAFGHQARHAFGRGMSTMGRAKRVVYIDVSDLGQIFGEGRIIGLFLVVIAYILQQQHIAGLHHGNHLLDLGADAIVGERHREAEESLQLGCHRAEGHGGFALAFGPAQVGCQDQLGTLTNQQPQRRQRLHDAGGVGDDHLAILFLQRYIVIHAHKHSLALHVQISNRQFCHNISSSELGAQSIPKRRYESKSIFNRVTCPLERPTRSVA